MKVAIVKYDAGNICSVVNAFKRLGVEPLLTDNADELKGADKVVFPGQGDASTTMRHLKEYHLDRLICDLRQPVLGICVGMQLMCRHSEEGDTDCLGIFDTDVVRFQPCRHEDKVPQMGWNTINDLKTPLFKDVKEGDFVYFIHSYHVECNPWSIATTEYVTPYCSAIHRDNFYACQFHPEKSGKVGERILRNFLDL